ncbi:hypothetical protein X801_03736 [Opisthorchis viverrini]|uniref:Sortilin N-terminal domain-containing protein n=1 Tax=Opisthorchis viverrini TaxID=6198 RepID=A0A1S8X0Y7_OPIVI|nr:hypothetical protein X801_03736 [Opisthorchis viverrini]
MVLEVDVRRSRHPGELVTIQSKKQMALDGPHHYQIANRGGLLVAVPADTLWPDVLRFSTDEGRCWHTIPLRAGAWIVDHTGGTSTTANVSVYTTPGNTTPTLLTTRGRNATVPPGYQPENHTSGDTTTTTPSTNYEAWIRGRADETVVFTGLVTEPGGRAMAAAVYGYGTVSQRWRVAVVDFTTNGMVTTPLYGRRRAWVINTVYVAPMVEAKHPAHCPFVPVKLSCIF